jgi:tight adherence protein B
MGALLGLVFGLGILLVWRSGSRRPRSRPRAHSRAQGLHERLIQAGFGSISVAQLYAVCAFSGLIVGVFVAAVSRSMVIAIGFASFAAYAPVALVKMRQRQRQTELRAVWPELVDNLVSAVRAGLSLPEAVGQLGTRGPEPLRDPFRKFADDYRASGRFGDCLDRLKARLADPVADRIVESLRLAREVGGSDLGRLLRTLSQFLREDARTRAELETRQGWTVNAARLALAAPWAVLGLLALRPDAVAAYDSAAGLLVLLAGGAVSIAAYRFMLRLARLPEDERVLR